MEDGYSRFLGIEGFFLSVLLNSDVGFISSLQLTVVFLSSFDSSGGKGMV